MSPSETLPKPQPVDILGRPLEVGDYVAFAKRSGDSAAMVVGQIKEFIWFERTEHKRVSDGDEVRWERVPVMKYKIKALPVKRTDGWSGELSGRLSTWENVDLIAKVEAPDEA